ncbi:MAG: xanthine dehydrogenase family protein subunit M, partial [Moorella sp. (in: Bacteria)]|nr:xanthine dehydrogenase family protein subunit M [Moorella sp. (in: firmicutes)]
RILFPTTVAEALEIMARESGYRVLAGGTDLVVAIKEGKEAPRTLISLSKVAALKGITAANGELRIGAATTLAAVEENDAIRSRYTALAEGAGQVGSWQVRNIATVGGNLCSAVPSADTAPPLLAAGASVKLVSLKGERVVSLADFFLGPMETVLQPGELLAEINLPPVPAGVGSCYLKIGPRDAMDIALVGVAAQVIMEDGVCRGAGLALGAVAPTPLKVTEAEKILTGSSLTAADIARAAAIAADAARPISDHRASADYRRKMVAVLTRRALQEAWARALSGQKGGERACS